MKKEPIIKVALLQMACSEYPEENMKKMAGFLAQAKDKGADIVCTQELFRTRYFCQVENQAFFKYAESIPGPTTETLSSLAKLHQVVLIGSLFEKDESQGVSYNTAVIFEKDGRLVGKYRKIHIPDDFKNYYGESFYFSRGDLNYPVFETSCGRVGLQVCYDQWFPEGARALAQAGAQIIFYPTAIGWAVNQPQSGVEGEDSEKDAWLTIQRGHAISNGVFVATVNRVGKEDHLQFWGTSFVSNPMGKLLAQGDSQNEEVLVVPCDLSQIDGVRKDWPFLKEC